MSKKNKKKHTQNNKQKANVVHYATTVAEKTSEQKYSKDELVDIIVEALAKYKSLENPEVSKTMLALVGFLLLLLKIVFFLTGCALLVGIGKLFINEEFFDALFRTIFLLPYSACFILFAFFIHKDSKTIVNEKDRNYIIGYLSTLLALIAVLIALLK